MMVAPKAKMPTVVKVGKSYKIPMDHDDAQMAATVVFVAWDEPIDTGINENPSHYAYADPGLTVKLSGEEIHEAFMKGCVVEGPEQFVWFRPFCISLCNTESGEQDTCMFIMMGPNPESVIALVPKDCYVG